ncbi:MAG: ArsA-related P-loop ATPase [Bdellovibrionota bacterium]
MTLLEVLAKKRVLICCGSGGVGKTSTSAALGLLAAKLGRKAIVVTVDPARRLATALGISLEDNAENRIPVDKIEAAGLHVPGEFYGMMLNAKRTFDEIVTRRASSPEARDRILNNPAYIHGSTALVGSPDYMAMEKLHELLHERNYDLLIVDTPPLKHALDFLSAPERFQGMLTDNPLIRILVQTMRSSGGRPSLFARAGKEAVFRVVSLVTGEKAIRDAAEFFGAFSDLMGGFSGRAKAMSRILRSPECGLLIVTSPNLITIEEALFLHHRIRGYGMPFAGFIVNRTRPDYFGGSGANYAEEVAAEKLKQQASSAGVAPELLGALFSEMRWHGVQRRTEEKNIALLERELQGAEFLQRVPEFPRDIADLKGLAELGKWLEGQEVSG